MSFDSRAIARQAGHGEMVLNEIYGLAGRGGQVLVHIAGSDRSCRDAGSRFERDPEFGNQNSASWSG